MWLIDWTELQSSHKWPSTPKTTLFRWAPPPQSMKCICTSSATSQSCSTNRLAVKTISLQASDRRDAKTVYCYCSQRRLCFMPYDAWFSVQNVPWQVKKKRSVCFSYQSVKSVKILMMSGMPFCFYILDFRHLYTSAMITWVRFILIDKEAVCNKN